MDRRDRSARSFAIRDGRVAGRDRNLPERYEFANRTVRARPNTNKRSDLSIAIEPVLGAGSSSGSKRQLPSTKAIHAWEKYEIFGRLKSLFTASGRKNYSNTCRRRFVSILCVLHEIF